MDAKYCTRVAEHYSVCARHMTDVMDKAVFFGLAAYWARRAEKAEREAKEEKTGSRVAISEDL
jgi:hypothetical protein